MTSFEKALQLDVTALKKPVHHGTYEANQVQKVHIFLSDGQITSDEKNPDLLKNIYSEIHCHHIFVGCGDSHDSNLMRTLASVPKGEYFFIESVENAGLVYGEIIHSSLYELLQDVHIEVKNGTIYDSVNNTWENNLHLSSLVSDKKRVLHVRHPPQVELCTANVTFTDLRKSTDTDAEAEASASSMVEGWVAAIADYSTSPLDSQAPNTTISLPIIRQTISATIHYPREPIDKNVEKYWWRQRTLEYMARVKNFHCQ